MNKRFLPLLLPPLLLAACGAEDRTVGPQEKPGSPTAGHSLKGRWTVTAAACAGGEALPSRMEIDLDADMLSFVGDRSESDERICRFGLSLTRVTSQASYAPARESGVLTHGAERVSCWEKPRLADDKPVSTEITQKSGENAPYELAIDGETLIVKVQDGPFCPRLHLEARPRGDGL